MAEKKVAKCVMVGDGAVGKMYMTTTYLTGEYPTGYDPCVCEKSQTEVTLGEDNVVPVEIWNTAGQEDYDGLRPLAYPGTDVFVLCFSVGSKSSMHNITTKWVPEIKHHCPNVPFMLVGTKMDVRADREEVQRLWEQYKVKPITTKEGRALASSLGAKCYMECSSKTGQNLKQTMEVALRIAAGQETRGKRRHPGKCSIL